MTSSFYETIILGAGIAGLTAGRHLHDHGFPVLLLDKGRGVGGRVATRRVGELSANHGAPCFRLDRAAVVSEWKSTLAQIVFAPAPRALDARGYMCAQSMSALPKALAKDLTIRLETQVTHISHQENMWQLTTQSGEVFTTRRLLITAPLQQAAALFQNSDPELEQRLLAKSKQVRYLPQWTAIVSWDQNSGPEMEAPYLRLAESEAICSIHEQVPRKIWVIQASRPWTEQHLEDQAQQVVSDLSQEVLRHFPEAKPFAMQAHRWRYAKSELPLAQSYLAWSDRPNLGFAGDFCIESTVMGAAESGLTWAKDQVR